MRRHVGWLVVLLLMANVVTALAQLNGTYTIGGSNANYSTITAAVDALTQSGVSGPVTFTIASGTYIPPSFGWTLGPVAGMGPTNQVTFKPAAGATVELKGLITTYSAGIFSIAGGRYFTIDGSNSGGGTRDMTITLDGMDDAAAVWINDGSSFNTVKNCKLQAFCAYGAAVVIGNNSKSGRNDSNAIINCLIGDPDRKYQSTYGIHLTGFSAATSINGTKIIGNEIVNVNNLVGVEPASIQMDSYAIGTIIDHNIIHQTRGADGWAVSAIHITNYSGSTTNTRIVGNTIYSMVGNGSILTPFATYGIYVWDATATRSSMLIANNMISIEARDGSTNYGIYIKQSSVGNRDSIFVLHNSIDAIDGGRGGSVVRMLQRDGTTNNGILTIADNIFYSQILTDNDVVHALYLSKTDGLTSDYNLIDVGFGANSNVSFILTSAYRTLALEKSATSYEAHSVGGNPQFYNPAHADLHISTSRRVPVSGRGSGYAQVGIDIDSTSRSSPPDIGADEGSFLDPLTNDVGVTMANVPMIGQKLRAGAAFTPSALMENQGTSSQSSVPVRCRIISVATGTMVYNDVQTIASLMAGERKRVSFGQNGNVQGSTSLQPGQYVAIIKTEMTSPTDGDASNDSVRVAFDIATPLAGTYTIDPAGSGLRNVRSITAAVNDLASLGVSTVQGDSAVTFLIAGGTYDESESFPIRIEAFAGASSAHTVTFRPFPNANVVVETRTEVGAAIDLFGCSYVKLDGWNGSSSGGSSWKIVNRSGPAVSFSHDATYSAIRNLTIQSSNVYGGAVTFEVPSNIVGNHYDTIKACTIGDTAGVVRSLSGIVSSGNPSAAGGGGYRDIAIIDNDIANFSIPSQTFDQAYGISTLAGARWTIDGNIIHNSRPCGGDRNIYTGIFCKQTAGVTLSNNRIFDLTGMLPLTDAYGIALISCKTSIVHDNFVSVGKGAAVDGYSTDEACGIVWHPLSGDTLKCYHNTVNISDSNLTRGYCLSMAGNAGIVFTAGVFGQATNACARLYNNIFTSSASGGGLLYRGNFPRLDADYNLYYYSYASARVVSLVDYDSVGNGLIIPFFSLPEWAMYSSQDVHTVFGAVTYRDGAGDLHIDTAAVFPGEDAGATSAVLGQPYPYPFDFDRAPRDTTMPDIGADDGDYNGGGITLVHPNGGDEYPVDYEMPVTFTIKRAMTVRIEFSTDDGNTWSSTGDPFPVAKGSYTVAVTTPDTVTSEARVRVISQRNQWEADTSDRAFSLVRPRFVVLQPNGGEVWTPTDTNAIRWTTEFLRPEFKVQLDYSIDAGATWRPIATDLAAPNLPDTNSFGWVIPDAPSTRAKVRVKLMSSTIADKSDSTFTILPKPYVEITTPNGERNLFVGELTTIRWSSVTTANIRLEYTTDAGASWLPISTTRITAETGSFPWRVPDTPSDSVLVRIVNVERPRFSDVSDRIFSIKHARVEVLSPNGGETYELNKPIAVTWRQNDVAALNIEYSFDYGATWKTLATSVPATVGSFSITPPAVPTRLALVRLTDAAHDWVSDHSDRPFQILPPKGIVIFTPAVGDELIRRATTIIQWRAERIDKVDLYYSLDNGATWNTIANGVSASQGSYVWSVPDQLTNQGMIRISESGGSASVERSFFRIINATVPVVRVIKPNGGERYTSGDPITIQWSATSDIAIVALSYSSDNGGSWNQIAGSVSAASGQYVWRSPLPAGARYRVKVESTIASDISDGPFEIVARPNPAIRVIGPNGGEVFTVGAATQVIWTATDVSGQVLVDYSTDDGATWSPIGAATASSGTINWTIPASATDKGRVRVTAADNSAQDMSDDRFTIKAKLLEPLRVVTPNSGTEIWTSGEIRTIVWEAPADVALVKLSYSLDGGNIWTEIGTFASTVGSNVQQWTVPMVAKETNAALIKVEDASDASRSDISDNPFTIRSGVTTGVARTEEAASSLALIEVTPNPGRDEMVIRWRQGTPGQTHLQLVDELGRLVFESHVHVAVAGDQALRLHVMDLPSGRYYFTIDQGRNELHGALMVAR